MTCLQKSILLLTFATAIMVAGEKKDTLVSQSKAIEGAKAFLKEQNYKTNTFRLVVGKHMLTLDSLLQIPIYRTFDYRRAKEAKKNLTYPFFWRITAVGKNLDRDGAIEILVNAKTGKWFYFSPVG